jgi:hypothetical protein
VRWGSSYFRSISDWRPQQGGTLLGPVHQSLRGWGAWDEDPGHAPNKRFAFASFLKKQILFVALTAPRASVATARRGGEGIGVVMWRKALVVAATLHILIRRLFLSNRPRIPKRR